MRGWNPGKLRRFDDAHTELASRAMPRTAQAPVAEVNQRVRQCTRTTEIVFTNGKLVERNKLGRLWSF